MTTQKEVLKVIGMKKPEFDKKDALKWLKKNQLFVQELDSELVANQYLNVFKEKERIDKLDVMKGILLGTIDIKWKSGEIKRVNADILTEEGDIVRVQWWSSIPRENKTMQTLPILHMCEFKGGINEWTAHWGETYSNFDVEAIIPTSQSVAHGDLSFNEFSMITIDTEMEDIPEGKHMTVVFGKITTINYFREKTWSKDEDTFVFSSEHPLLLRDNLCLTMGIRVNEDIYIRGVHFPEQKLGYPTWIINDDFEKVDTIKKILAKMPVDAKSDKDIPRQLQRQLVTVNSILNGYLVMVVGEITVKRVESADEVRTFIDMYPTFISIRSAPPEEEKVTQTTLEEEPEEKIEEKVVIEKMVDEAEAEAAEAEAEDYELSIIPPPTGLTEAKLIFEAVNDLGPNGEALARAKVNEIKQQYKRFNMEINLENIIKTAAEELKIDITGYEKKQARLAEERAKEAETKAKAVKEEKKRKKKPTPPKKRIKKKAVSAKKWDHHYIFINEVLGSLKENEEVDVSLLPMPVWDILLDTGYCFEPKEGVITIILDNSVLDVKTKKALHKFFNKNPDLKLRPDPIEDIEKAIREKLIELKEIAPNASPEHLKPMLTSFNIDAPVELIAKIWEKL